MPRTISDTTTLGELEQMLHSFGLTLFTSMSDGKWTCAATGRMPDLTVHTAFAVNGSSLADVVSRSITEWCDAAGAVIIKPRTRSR